MAIEKLSASGIGEKVELLEISYSAGEIVND